MMRASSAVSTSTSAATANNTSSSQTTLRLRKSCDRCQAAKVKCSRMKPSCWRCSQDRQECVYSAFRRTGRPRKTAQPGHAPSGSRVSAATASQANGKPVDGTTTCAGGSGGGGSVGDHTSPHGEVQNTEKHEALKQQRQLPLVSTISHNQPSPQHHDDFPLLDHTATTTASNTTATTPRGLHNPSDFSWVSDGLLMDLDASDFDGHDSTMDSSHDLDLGLTLAMQPGSRNASINSLNSAGSPSAWKPALWSWTPQSWDAFDVRSTHSAAAAEGGESTYGSETLSSMQGNQQHDMHTRASSSQSAMETADDALSEGNQHHIPLPPTTTATVSVSSKTNSITSSNTGSPSSIKTNSNANSNSKCYRAVAEILGQLHDERPEGEMLSLDRLLGLDRQLRNVMRRVLTCRLCANSWSGQTMIMLLYMALDSLLGHFERQKDVVVAPSTMIRPFKFVTALDGGLKVADLSVNEKVKAVFQRHLVLEFLGNHDSTLSQLEQKAEQVLRGVYHKSAKCMTADIRRRASFLRGWLRLSK